MSKKIIALLLTVILVVQGSVIVFATENIEPFDPNTVTEEAAKEYLEQYLLDFAEESRESLTFTQSEEDVLTEFLTAAFHYGSEWQAFEDEVGAEIPIRLDDVQNLSLSSALIQEADQFLDDYYATYAPLTRATYSEGPSSLSEAKATAMAYCFDRARFSATRRGNEGLGQEAKYMFMSFYIDTSSYYWADKDERLLRDMSWKAGSNGDLADYITDLDRRQYRAYISSTGASEAFNSIAQLVLNVDGVIGNVNTLSKGQESLEKASKVFKVGLSLTLDDAALTITDIMGNSVFPLLAFAFEELSADPNLSLSMLYDRLMLHEGLQQYYHTDAQAIASSTIALLASILTGGVDDVVKTITVEALKFEFNFANNFFQYAAWVSLRYSWSSRYSQRVWDYMFG